MHRTVRLVAGAVTVLALLQGTACSPGLGGATHPKSGTVVVPAPSGTVCTDGTEPPCK
jgi:hypothetical protein